MASSWTHAAAAVAIAAPLVPANVPRRIWLTVAIAAVLPDLDAIGRPFGGGDLEWLGGHRALTHSLTLAAVFGLLLQYTVVRAESRADAARFWVALTLGIASHGVLDSLTSYGEGIQFLAPWSARRYWAPWRLLGDGILRDSIAFVLFYVAARATIARKRRYGLPRIHRE